MEFGILTIALLVVATVLVLLGLRILFARGWFVHFLRGFAGFGLLLLAGVVIMIGLNLASYAQLSQGQGLANISFTKIHDQQYEATVATVHSGEEIKFIVDGDMWLVSGRKMDLAGAPNAFYRLESITGRYYSLEQQRSSANSFNTLPDSSIGLDLWGIFKNKNIGFLSTSQLHSKYLPMADGAVFSVSIAATGLQSSPVNQTAKSIDNEWQ